MTVADRYHQDGFVVLKDAVRIPQHMYVERAFLKDVCAVQGIDAFRSEARLLAKRVEVMRLFLAPDMLRAVQMLGVRQPIMQTAPVCHAMGFDQTFDGTAPHQDWPALQSGLNTVVAWIPLHTVGEEHYPLEIARGSHLLGLLPAKAGVHYSEVDASGLTFEPVLVPVGSVILFSVVTVHRTRTSGTKTRLALSHRYEDALDPAFVNRGYPSAQSRVIEREMKWTPTQADVQAVFA